MMPQTPPPRESIDTPATKATLRQRALGFVRRHRIAVVIVFPLYLATGLLGIPHLHSHLRSRVQEAHANFVEYEAAMGLERTSLPVPHFEAFSFPVFPGIIFCAKEYTIAGLDGAGNWCLYWVASPAPIELFNLQMWVS